MERFPSADTKILVTGAAGFVGRRVVALLLERGYDRLVALTRPAPRPPTLDDLTGGPWPDTRAKVVQGDLLSEADCRRITEGVDVVLHLAAGRGAKSFPDAFLNTVVTTRNLLRACVNRGGLRRFVNVSTFAVYAADERPRGALLDESCPLEKNPARRGQAYCFAKTRQETLVQDFVREHGLPCVTLRPGVVYGPGNEAIPGRVGVGTFGLFLHMGGGNPIPLSYVDNCAEAIVLAGLVPGVEGERFNVLDDDLPTSRAFLRAYKRQVGWFPSLYLPPWAGYAFCRLWEGYSRRSQGQLPPVYNRAAWHANWKRLRYSNAKLKDRLGWRQRVPTDEGLRRYFESCRKLRRDA